MVMVALSLASSAWLRIEKVRAFSTYEAYSRAAPERRMLAFARVIPITPKAPMIAMIVTVISS
jgi:hypothetical protein